MGVVAEETTHEIEGGTRTYFDTFNYMLPIDYNNGHRDVLYKPSARAITAIRSHNRVKLGGQIRMSNCLGLMDEPYLNVIPFKEEEEDYYE